MRTKLMVGLLVLAVFAVYMPSLWNGFVNWDDPRLVYENPAVREISVSSLRTIFTTYDPKLYIPFTLFTYQIEHAIAGFSPTIFHLTSLLFHIANVLLFFALLCMWLKNKWIAFFAALLFGLHPMNVEAVAWVSARKDVLSSFFFLLSLVLYFRIDRKFFSLATFLLALLAKPVAITLPIILLIIDRKHWKKIIPFFALSALFTVIALLGFRGDIGESGPLLLRIGLAGEAMALYLSKFIAPVGLSAMYVSEGLSVWSFIGIVAGVSLFVAAILLRRFDTRISFGILLFLIVLLPTLLKSASPDNTVFAADRYLYLPSIGLILALSVTVERLILHGRYRRIVTVLAVLCSCFFVYQTHTQSLVWRTSETLFTDVVTKQPNAYIAWGNLGVFYIDEGRYEEATVVLTRALEIEPWFTHAKHNLAVAIKASQP